MYLTSSSRAAGWAFLCSKGTPGNESACIQRQHIHSCIAYALSIWLGRVTFYLRSKRPGTRLAPFQAWCLRLGLAHPRPKAWARLQPDRSVARGKAGDCLGGWTFPHGSERPGTRLAPFQARGLRRGLVQPRPRAEAQLGPRRAGAQGKARDLLQNASKCPWKLMDQHAQPSPAPTTHPTCAHVHDMQEPKKAGQSSSPRHSTQKSITQQVGKACCLTMKSCAALLQPAGPLATLQIG